MPISDNFLIIMCVASDTVFTLSIRTNMSFPGQMLRKQINIDL